MGKTHLTECSACLKEICVSEDLNQLEFTGEFLCNECLKCVEEMDHTLIDEYVDVFLNGDEILRDIITDINYNKN
jgi:hypothetical protein